MPNWIGDYLMALTVLSGTPAARRGAMTVIAPAPLVPLHESLSPLPALPYRRGRMAARRASLARIRAARFTDLYLLPHSFSSALTGALARVPRRRGISADLRRPLLTDPLPRSTADRTRHLVREYAAVLETEPLDPAAWPGHPLPGVERGRSIVFCPGARYGPAKQWGGFPRLAEILGGEPITILGGAGDRAAGDEIAAAAPGRVRNLAGETSLVEAARAIAAARYVVSNDSGLMHLAAYLGTPVVGIFGSTDPRWTHPLGRHATVVRRPEPCAPCFRRTCRYNHYHCLTAITPGEVRDRALAIG